jgi:nicotinamidase-related amidase
MQNTFYSPDRYLDPGVSFDISGATSVVARARGIRTLAVIGIASNIGVDWTLREA